MQISPLIILTLALSAAGCVMVAFWLGAFVYQKGLARQSVTPKIIENITNPQPKPAEPPKPVCPYIVCPFCAKRPKWVLAKDESVWICSYCENVIAGPKPRIPA